MTNALLQQNIVSLFGLNTLLEDEQSFFLSQIGEVVLETTLVRLVCMLTDDENYALTQYLESEPSADMLLQHLFGHYKATQDILEEVAIEFKEDALAVLSKASRTTQTA